MTRTIPHWQPIRRVPEETGIPISLTRYSIGPIDFHLGTANLDNLGTPVAQVTDDLDGDPRDPLTPDIGADEFSAPAGNIEVLSVDPMIRFPRCSGH
jgi:hypothetical protein